MNAIAQAGAGPVSGSKLDNRRVIAGLIDVAIVAVGAAVIMAAAGVLGDSPSEAGAPLTAVTIGWALYYYFACESGGGQTVGKRVMNIRVVSADGSPADMREIALRTVLRVVDGLFFYLVGLIVMIATGERRARLGDLVGNTRIVSADQAAPMSVAPAPEDPVSRVPIAESGPAFEPTPEPEPEVEPEPETIELTSPSLQELAVDVAETAGSAPDEEEPEAEAAPEPRGEEPDDDELLAEEPEAEAAPEPRGEEPDDDELLAEEAEAEEPEPEEPEPDEPEPDEPEADEPEVSVKSVETISAIDLVMEDSGKKS